MDINIDRICRENAKSNFYYSFAFLPKHKSEAINKVYSFCQVSDEIADCNLDLETKKKNFEEWKRELHLAFGSESSIKLLNDIKKIASDFSIPKTLFFELLEGMEMDLNNSSYDNFEDLELYCYKVASVVGLISINIFGYKHKSSEEFAINLGKALQLTNILRDVKSDFRIGRIYFPYEDMKRFNVSKDDFKNEVLSERLYNLLYYYYEKAIYYYKKSYYCLNKEDNKNFLVAHMMKNIYYEILQKIKKQNFDIFNRNFKISKPRKIFIILKTILNHYI